MGLIMTMLKGIGISYTVKAGRKLAENRGWMPVGHYHRLAGEAVERGDLDAAIKNNVRARRRVHNYAPALAQRDLLIMAVTKHEERARRELVSCVHDLKATMKKRRRLLSIQVMASVVGGVLGYCVAITVVLSWFEMTLGGGIMGSSLVWLILRSRFSQVLIEIDQAKHASELAGREEEKHARRRALLT